MQNWGHFGASYVFVMCYSRSDSLASKDRLSDAGCPRFESQTRRVTGKSIPSFWRDRHPAIKGLRPPECHARHPIRTEKTPPSQALILFSLTYVIEVDCTECCINGWHPYYQALLRS